MTKEREALKMALEALERYETKRQDDRFAELITAIKEALTQLEPTPEQLAALGWQSIECPFCGSSGARAFPKPDCDWEGIAADQAMTIALMKSEQPEQECVAVINVLGNDWRIEYLSLPVGKHRLYAQQYTYTTPPKREWVGLTEMDIRNIFPHASYPLFLKTVSAIEAKLKELNHG